MSFSLQPDRNCLGSSRWCCRGDEGTGRSLARTALHLNSSLQISRPSPTAAVDLASGSMVLEGGWGWGEFINVASRAFESGLPGAPLLPHDFNKVWGSPGKSIYKGRHRLFCVTKFSLREKHPCVIYTRSQRISCSQARGDEIRSYLL